MSPQGFQEVAASDAGVRPPRGFGAAKATLGNFSETTFFDKAVWGADDYRHHWQASASACLAGETLVAFCMGIGDELSDVLLVWSVGSTFDIQQLMVPTKRLAIEGMRIGIGTPKFWPEASTWKATAIEMREIAAGT